MNAETYAARAQLHKPQTPEEIQVAARDLAAQGFGDYTIAHVLAMDVNAVRQMIGDPHTTHDRRN